MTRALLYRLSHRPLFNAPSVEDHVVHIAIRHHHGLVDFHPATSVEASHRSEIRRGWWRTGGGSRDGGWWRTGGGLRDGGWWRAGGGSRNRGWWRISGFRRIFNPVIGGACLIGGCRAVASRVSGGGGRNGGSEKGIIEITTTGSQT